jgi:hypothetical protein
MEEPKPKFNIQGVGNISNYYGGLYVMQNEGRYYWIIENYNTDFDDLTRWHEIEKELYDCLIAHEETRINP